MRPRHSPILLALDGWADLSPASATICFATTDERRFTQDEVDRMVQVRITRLERQHAKDLEDQRSQLEERFAQELSAARANGASATDATTKAQLLRAQKRLEELRTERDTIAKHALSTTIANELERRGIAQKPAAAAVTILFADGAVLSWDSKGFQLEHQGRTFLDAASVADALVAENDWLRAAPTSPAPSKITKSAPSGAAHEPTDEELREGFGRGLEAYGRATMRKVGG